MIHLHLEGIPLSTNHAYDNMRGGGRRLSKAGEKYINETKDTLVRQFRKELMFLKPDTMYLVCFRFYFKEIENAGWFKGTAKSRYKQIDVSNRVKLLEDCLKNVAGIDDSQNMRVILDKQLGKERTDIWIWNLEEEETPFDVGFNSL